MFFLPAASKAAGVRSGLISCPKAAGFTLAVRTWTFRHSNFFILVKFKLSHFFFFKFKNFIIIVNVCDV